MFILFTVAVKNGVFNCIFVFDLCTAVKGYGNFSLNWSGCRFSSSVVEFPHFYNK